MSDARIAVISTSINPRPKAYEQWAKVGDLYVAGDLNTPPELGNYVSDLGGRYIAPADQDEWRCSNAIGWRNIQRRNAALLEALQYPYEYFITVDDDNLPDNAMNTAEQYRKGITYQMTRSMKRVSMVTAPGMWYNPGRLAHSPYRQRGLPANYKDMDSPYRTEMQSIDYEVGVLQSYITGDPDTDAVQRIVNPPTVRYYEQDVFPEPGLYAPFNSQATVWQSKYAPLMAVLPGCQRYDDIYGSLIAQRILHHRMAVVMFTGPYVHQERNKHDLGVDLKAEVDGMHNVDTFVRLLDDLKLSDADDIMEHYTMIANELVDTDLITMRTYGFMMDFMTDVRATGWSAE